jgi:hypothetical protein
MLVLLVSATPLLSLPDSGGAIEIPRYAAISISNQDASEARICIPELQLCRGEFTSPEESASFSCRQGTSTTVPANVSLTHYRNGQCCSDMVDLIKRDSKGLLRTRHDLYGQQRGYGGFA